DSEVSALILDEINYAQRSAQLAEEAKKLGLTLFSMGPSEFADDLTTAAAAVGDQPMIVTGQADDRAIISYTGGTTGRPKGAERMQANQLHGAIDILTDFNLPDQPQYLLVAPMSHVAGTK